MVFLYGIILTMRAKVGMMQENYGIIDGVNCKVEEKQFAQFKKIICRKSWYQDKNPPDKTPRTKSHGQNPPGQNPP